MGWDEAGRTLTIETLGDLIDTGRLVSAYCNDCKRGTWLDIPAIAARIGRDVVALGPDTPFRRGLRCSACGSHNTGFRLHASGVGKL